MITYPSSVAPLLAAIRADPGDDAPRHALADALLGAGNPRGRYIRLACRLAAEPDAPEAGTWKEEADALLAAHGATWIPFATVAVTWQRGFPHRIVVSQRDVLQAGEVPGLVDLEVIGCQNAVTETMANASILRPVHTLRLDTATSKDPLGSSGFAALVQAPLSIRVLTMRSRVGPDGFLALAASPLAGRLEVLSLGDVHPGPGARGLRALLPALTALHTLRLHAANVTDSAAAALSALPPTVTKLDLSWNGRLGAGLRHLRSPTLTDLDLSGLALTPDVTELPDRLPALRILRLRHATGVQALSTHPRVQAGELTLVTA